MIEDLKLLTYNCLKTNCDEYHNLYFDITNLTNDKKGWTLVRNRNDKLLISEKYNIIVDEDSKDKIKIFIDLMYIDIPDLKNVMNLREILYFLNEIDEDKIPAIKDLSYVMTNKGYDINKFYHKDSKIKDLMLAFRYSEYNNLRLDITNIDEYGQGVKLIKYDYDKIRVDDYIVADGNCLESVKTYFRLIYSDTFYEEIEYCTEQGWN